MWQVHDGYHKEYPLWGTTPVPSGVNKAYIAMVVILATVYVAGLALLPKQYKLESERAQNGPAGAGEGASLPLQSVAGLPKTN